MKTRIAIRKQDRPSCRAFTLIELLMVVAIIGILASLLFVTLGSAKNKAKGIACLSNTRQLTYAWLIYAQENGDRLIYNIGGDSQRGIVKRVFPPNWVNGVLDWELTSDNTDTALISGSGLAPYVGGMVELFRCPSDAVLSTLQRQAGWSSRTRSFSMNAMVGDAGEASLNGYNVNNPSYVQFFKLGTVPRPESIFVFVDEHPDSINDGYFLNRPYHLEWIDLPASWHNGASSLSFADGHSELHRWINPLTRRPPVPDGAQLPAEIPETETADFDWLVRKASIHR